MSDIQRVVDELRFILQREYVEQSDELTRVLMEYSALCHDVNQRLRRCDQCLKQGLRSEALHLAQASPDLLDAVAVLDFPERSDLLDVISLYFLNSPEPLLLDVATSLNAAYVEHAPLEKMLELHRLLALGRSPLNHRLGVLRSLATLDADSPHWEADIREMERARFREMEAESVAAAKSGNTVALKSLLTEIQAAGWRETIPTPLVRDIKSRASQITRGSARQRMQELNELLYSAFSALDAAAARPLREEWNQTQRVGQVDKNDPLCEYVAPVLEWLQDEDRKEADTKTFTRLVAEIEQTLENETVPAAELKRLNRDTERLERALPPALEARFRSRLNTMEFLDARRRKLIAAAIVGSVAVVVGAIGFLMYRSAEADKTNRLVATINGFIDEGKLAEAQKVIEEHPSRSASENWVNVRKKLSDAEQAEKDRIINWKAEIATAQGANELTTIEAAINRARELSKTSEEKIEVGQLHRTWQKRANEELAAREKEFRNLIAAASESLGTLDKEIRASDTTESEQVKPLLEMAEKQVARMTSLRDGVAKDLGSQATLLQSRLTDARKSAADLTRKLALLTKITDSSLVLPEGGIGSARVGAFEAALKQFATDLPNDSRATTMKSAAEASPIKGVMARQELMVRWRRYQPFDQKDIETRLRELRAFLTEYPQSPDRNQLTEYETCLVAFLRRFEEENDPDEGIRKRMFKLFSGKFIKEGHVVIDNQRRTYYLEKAQSTPFGDGSVAYVSGFNGEKKRELKTDQLLTPTSVAAPQQELSAHVRATVREINLDGWRDYFRELAESLMKADKVDPILRYLLLVKTLEFAGQGDRLLELELAPLLEKLNDDELDRSVPWMDPTNEPAKKARTRAVELLAKIPALEPIFTNASKRQEQFEKDLFSRRFSVGWLEKSSRGEWVCRSKWTTTSDFELRVVSLPDASESRSWLVLGRMQANAVNLFPEVAQSVGEGTVVFASSPKLEVKTALAK